MPRLMSRVRIPSPAPIPKRFQISSETFFCYKIFCSHAGEGITSLSWRLTSAVARARQSVSACGHSFARTFAFGLRLNLKSDQTSPVGKKQPEQRLFFGKKQPEQRLFFILRPAPIPKRFQVTSETFFCYKIFCSHAGEGITSLSWRLTSAVADRAWQSVSACGHSFAKTFAFGLRLNLKSDQTSPVGKKQPEQRLFFILRPTPIPKRFQIKSGTFFCYKIFRCG